MTARRWWWTVTVALAAVACSEGGSDTEVRRPDLPSRAPARGELAGFQVVATIQVGQNPHQIAFAADGRTAYVAAAGSDRITVIDAETHEVTGGWPVAGTPLGIAVLADGGHVVASRFQGDEIARYAIGSEDPVEVIATGVGASLFAGPLPGDTLLVSVERANQLRVLHGPSFTLEHSYATGARPFPPAATSDGRLAFVPAYDDGTVTAIDLWNERIVATVPVGERPSGGSVLPGDIDYAVAIRGEDRVVFVNTASFQVSGELTDGIGDEPFSVVVSPDGHLAFVNNTASHDISVIALPERVVVARIPVADIPIVMAVHPSGDALWVSSEGVHQLTIIEIPAQWRVGPADDTPAEAITEVAVMGMIHGGHLTSDRWGLDQVESTIRSFQPDAICVEIPPNRWERVWRDYTERGVVEDPRTVRFPEYNDRILALAVELGIEIIPCAAWTTEMNDLRAERTRQFNENPEWAEQRAAFERENEQIRRSYEVDLGEIDDPRVLHSDIYDNRARQELSLRDRYISDWQGPGGWRHINEAHMRWVNKAVDASRGRRLLVTFGAGHKYWFLDALGKRSDVRLLDLREFLPQE